MRGKLIYSFLWIKRLHLFVFLVLQLPIILLLFNSCTLGPPYSVPYTPMPQQWKATEAASKENSIPFSSLENWWEVFKDPTLNDLEEQAVRNNRNIYVSIARVFQARAMAGVRGADLYPQINLEGDYQNIGALVKIFGLPPTVPPTPSIIRTHYVQNALPLNLKYEMDLWGKLKNLEKSALLEVEAKEMALTTALLILSADLASEYFQLRVLDAQIALIDETIKVRKAALNIHQERYNSGFIAYIDVVQDETLLYDAESQYFRLTRERTLKENKIAVLIGMAASDFQMENCPLQNEPPGIPVGIPSTILMKRPDVREAERHAASEQALIGSAYASFFPSITLTGALGFSSPDLHDFLTWKSRLWSMGANVIEPIVDGRRNAFNLDLAYARFGEASSLYQQNVLVAFQEVEDALTSIELEAKEMEQIENMVQSTEKTRELAEDRYINGLINYLEVVDSERSTLDAKGRRIDLLGQRYLSVIRLIKALGGSWEK